MFSFFLTTATGDRKFCWCFRFLPTDTNIPEAICIVSAIGETCLYQQLLRVLKQAREYSAALARQTMQAAYKLKFPKVKKELYIVAEVCVRACLYVCLFVRSFVCLFVCSFALGLLLQLMATILLERKVILVARRISTLSSCIMSICTLLYPFSWPHTLITVLPPSLADVIDSPAPYILGVLSCFKHLLEEYQLSEVLIVNLDEGYFMKWMGDEGHILPKKIQRALMLALSDVHLAHDNTGKTACITDVTMTEAFVRMFVEMCGHYCDFIRYDANKSSLFQREEFVRAVSSNSIRLFLDWFSRTPMFQVFITDRLKENTNQDLFDQRIKEYRREMEYLSNNKAANMKVIRDKLLNFFKNYGTKLKKTMKKNSYV
ncbi:hypothetical protein HELRODRAFT_102916 [Helobdella robusta]|uniref:UDENN domain-containing protein n=1 Tax=Helobdella robusta TaxID=6412 RepID=T1EDD1_HELRO|nr:hypothetical protein HELRODRAFT_102916 [Helobdella robusta]ESN94928.1 hypothetical protein HELRODRAFT_102916 [Helobdella robusta]